ncbi:MAG: hypothetical protein RL328_599 [Acidobacteriota bacterium]
MLRSGALELDRRWALLDSRGRFVNGKNCAEVHSVRAGYDLANREVSLNGQTFSLDRQGAEIAQWFSTVLGEPVTWQENAEVGFPDDLDSPGPTFVSTASLQQVAGWFGFGLDAARRRFRTNVEFEAPQAFWEDQLYGSRFRVGGVEVEAVNPCQRCVVPSRDPLTGASLEGFQKRFAQRREAELPQFARRAGFTHFYRLAVNTRIAATEAGKTIQVGDPLSAG